MGQTVEPISTPWFFRGDGTRAADVAAAISERWGVSVLLRQELGERIVSGQLVAREAAEAVEALAFLVGSKSRADVNGRVYFIGEAADKVVRSFPSYGLTSAEVKSAIREGASVVADRIVVETDPVHAAQVGEVLSGFSNRMSLTMEIVVLDVASNSVDRVNAWLDTVNVAGGYATKSAVNSQVPLGGITQVSDRGWTWDMQLSALFSMLDVGGDAKVELRQQVQVLSGGRTHFESGEVIETPLIVREPQTGRDLITSIDRRTVGLTVELAGTHFSDRWLIDLTLNDSSLQSGREIKTGVIAQKMLRLDTKVSLLASFTRVTSDRLEKAVPVLGAIPKIGRALFRKSVANHGNRSVMVLCRPVVETGI